MVMTMTGACTLLVVVLTHIGCVVQRLHTLVVVPRVPNGNAAGIPLGMRSQLHLTTELSLGPGAGKLGGGAQGVKN